MPQPVLHGERVTLRPLSDADVDLLAEAVEDPSIRRWWGRDNDPRSLREGFWNDGTGMAIEAGGELAGWIAWGEEDEPDYKHAALDVMLRPPFQGRGLGREALRTLIRWLADERGHHRFTIDPALANERAIAAYRAVGFKDVGVLRRYDRRPDGEWEDGLLMDLLIEELS
jgi:aminoglycoside 6'-N-acetyltransferase